MAALVSNIVRAVMPDKDGNGPEPDPYVDERVRRGRARLRELAPVRNECWEFFRGNTYVYRTHENQLVAQPTGTSIRGKGKEPHRVRTRRPVLTPFVRQEVSAATSRVPGYDIVPSNTDHDTLEAAETARRVAIYGFEKWDIKRVTEQVVTSAVVADEGFAWPYWDPDAGKAVGVEEIAHPETGEVIGTKVTREGDVRIRTYTANEVGWEPGARFEDSRWFLIQQVRPLSDVQQEPGLFPGVEIAADGTDQTVVGNGKPRSNSKLVLVVEYLERPSRRHESGRRIVMANGRMIKPEEPYPCQDSKGNILDEPVLHKLSVIRDPDSDHDLGPTRLALDAIRTYQDCENKILEWKNLAVNQQMLVPYGMQYDPLDDVPGKTFRVSRPDMIQWRPIAPFPEGLVTIQQNALATIGQIFSQNQISSNIEAGSAISQLIARDSNARGSFLRQVEDWHSNLMRHCLYLVAQYYTTERDLAIVGDFAPADILHGFQGAQMMDQTQVRVRAGSLDPMTREQVWTQATQLLQLGTINPEQFFQVTKDGTLDSLGDAFQRDRARAFLIIRKIKEGPESLFSMPPEYKELPAPPDPMTGMAPVDPATGMPAMQATEVPGWMPRDVDNVRVQKDVFAQWMKSTDWLTLEDGMREAARLYWMALDQLEQEANMKAQQQMTAQAQGLGEANAAKPSFSPMPSLPNPSTGDPAQN